MSKELEDAPSETDAELDIHDASQLHYWMEQWDVSECDLRMAVAKVGTEVAELRVALGR